MKVPKIKNLVFRALDRELLHKIYLKFHKRCHRDLFYHILKQKGKRYDYFFLKFNFDADIFSDQINWLRRLGFKAVGLTEFLNNNEAYKNQRTFSISTDDGYSENHAVVLPLLEKYKIPCTFYLVNNALDNKSFIWNDRLSYIENSKYRISEVAKKAVAQKFDLSLPNPSTNLIDWSDSWPGDLVGVISKELWLKSNCPPEAEVLNNLKPYLSSEQVRTIIAAGFEIGAHTCSHYDLAKLDYRQAYDEIVPSFKRLREDFNCKVQYFAYPYGSRIKPEHEIKIIKAAGAKVFFGTVNKNTNQHDHPFFQRDYMEKDFLTSKIHFTLLPLAKQHFFPLIKKIKNGIKNRHFTTNN